MLLRVGRDRVLLTEPCEVSVADLSPGDVVDVEVTCDYGPAPDGSARVWTARASFAADVDGSVRVAGSEPTSGDWVGDPSGHGPWWSASLERARGGSRHPSDLIPTRITATCADESETAELTRLRALAPGRRADEDWGRCRTRTYLPHRDQPVRAGLVVVGGSGGGMPYDGGWRMLASTGVAVTTVEYFGPPGLPAELDSIPVEVALDAADELAGHEVPGRPGILGVSRGSELALLAASTWPDRFGGAFAVASSGVANVGLGQRGPTNRSAWTVNGDAVPFYNRSIDEGAIAVERIDGPLVTLVAGDDQLWPSEMLTAPAVTRRATASRARDRHLVFANAGHSFFGYPGVPVGDPAREAPVHTITGETMTMGGTRRGNAIARDRSWRELLAFTTHLAAE